MSITTHLLTESKIESCLPALAGLRLEVFKEFPYLYAGSPESEERYLRIYAESPGAAVITVNDGVRVVGAVTGLPLRHEQAELTAPFAATDHLLDSIYYIGELLFYPTYRNRGLGQAVIALLEKWVRSSGCYRSLTCATVVRPVDHCLRPADYQPIERFLRRTGFIHLPAVTASFSWCETDGVSRDHLMQFWLKNL